MSKPTRAQYILTELAYHLPYSIFGVTMAIFLVGILSFFTVLLKAQDVFAHASEDLFHVAHASHVLLSTVVTTAVFWKHEKRVLKAAAVGLLGSLVICTLSDIFFPFFGGKILGVSMDMHICILEEPGIVLPFGFVGLAAGFFIIGAVEKSIQYSHSGHVLVSSMASLLYLLSFGVQDWVHLLGAIFLVTIVSVMIPCCMSDIVLPLMCVHRDCAHGEIESYENK